MRAFLPEKLKILAKNCPKPLYVVGGFTRDFLAQRHSAKPDVDICGCMLAEDFAVYAQNAGLTAQAVL